MLDISSLGWLINFRYYANEIQIEQASINKNEIYYQGIFNSSVIILAILKTSK